MFSTQIATWCGGRYRLLHNGRIVLIADTLVHEWPEPEDLANIAERAAGVAWDLGIEPRVAFVSFQPSVIRYLNAQKK